MAKHLFSIHDWNPQWGSLVRDSNVTAWAVHSESIGSNAADLSSGNYEESSRYNVTPLIRLNHSHHGSGTLPIRELYVPFSIRCKNFVQASSGCRHWIIGNEPNWSVERPEGQVITPEMYGEAFNLCYAAIKSVSREHQVIVAPVAPYNIESGPWIDYYARMLQAIPVADGLSLHFYSRGSRPEDVSSEARMDPPYQNLYNGFRAYRDFLRVVPGSMRHLPVYATEANQMVPWVNQNSGWVKAAYREIEEWNRSGGQKIHCLTLYRWENYDQFGLKDKGNVMQDFKEAMQQGSQVYVPIVQKPVEEKSLEWDVALDARGVKRIPAQVTPGATYWKLIKARWLDTQVAQREFGPDHHILVDALDEQGKRVTGISFIVSWPSGSDRITTKGNNGYQWAADYGMSKSLNEYSITAVDAKPSDSVTGIGMGKDGNSGEHTSTYLVFQRTVAGGKQVSDSPSLQTMILVHPVVDPAHRIVTQPFGARPEYYSQFKIDGVPLRGHEGVDFGTPVGAVIQAVDDGTVIEAADQENTGYGKYIKIRHSWGESVYAHLSHIAVQVGDAVSRTRNIGLSGATGNVTGPHLHFGIRINPFNRADGWGGYKDPIFYIPPPTTSQNNNGVLSIVKAAAQEFQVDWRLLVSLVHAESSFNPQAYNSSSGASGLGQLMPGTWTEWSAKVGASNIKDAKDNARVSAAYLSWCIKTTGSVRKGLWAYVWGIGNVQSGIEIPASVLEYATKIIHGSEVLGIVNP